eukprot:3939247-Rhodomonas_salina.2
MVWVRALVRDWEPGRSERAPPSASRHPAQKPPTSPLTRSQQHAARSDQYHAGGFPVYIPPTLSHWYPYAFSKSWRVLAVLIESLLPVARSLTESSWRTAKPASRRQSCS